MRHKFYSLLFTLVFLLTLSVSVFGEYSGPTYDGKWILFGTENQYMMCCPAYYFDNSLWDVYNHKDDDEPELVYYLFAKPDYFFHDLRIGNSKFQNFKGTNADEIMKELEEREYTATQYDQYGLHIIQGTGGLDSESPTGDPEWFSITICIIMEEDEIAAVIYHQYQTPIDEKDIMEAFVPQMMKTIQPVNGSVPEIGQYAFTSIIMDEEEYPIAEEFRGDCVLTLAEDGCGFLWAGEMGYLITSWTKENEHLSITLNDYAVYEATLEDDVIKLELSDGILYGLTKTQDTVLMPYVPEEETQE